MGITRGISWPRDVEDCNRGCRLAKGGQREFVLAPCSTMPSCLPRPLAKAPHVRLPINRFKATLTVRGRPGEASKRSRNLDSVASTSTPTSASSSRACPLEAMRSIVCFERARDPCYEPEFQLRTSCRLERIDLLAPPSLLFLFFSVSALGDCSVHWDSQRLHVCCASTRSHREFCSWDHNNVSLWTARGTGRCSSRHMLFGIFSA